METKELRKQALASFNASGVGVANNQMFALPFDYEMSDLILLPVPWEATVSYRPGTAKGPENIMKASVQVDLYDNIYPKAWQRGIFTKKMSASLVKKNRETRRHAESHIHALEKGKQNNMFLDEINSSCEQMNKYVYKEASAILAANKLLGLVGGDHSTPLGYIQALGEKHGGFGILQIDAHADLRDAYEGFTYSHASIMFNALKNPNVKKLVQVGIRDICDEEIQYIDNSERRVITYFDSELKNAMFAQIGWGQICSQVIEQLPANVYVSFDIDGLDPKLCPATGTPVPGGLSFEQAVFLIEEIIRSGRKIIGFDLVEVAPGKDEWNAIVGARMLFKLCHLILKSNS